MKNKLKIWIVREGEGFSIDEGARLMRAGLLAEYLAKKGHEVTWWASTYVHGKKQYLYNEHKEIMLHDNLRLVLLHSNVSYSKNVSLTRIKYSKCLASEFSKHAQKESLPDIIVCGWPTPEFAAASVEFGKKYHVPVILDARDEWPDIFVRAFPKKLQGIAKLALVPMKKKAAKTFGNAAGIVSVTPFTLEWACAYANRTPGQQDETVFIGCESLTRSMDSMQQIVNKWIQQGVNPNAWNVCYIGTLSASSIDLETVIKAVRQLSSVYLDVYLLIGGDGDDANRLKQLAGDCKNIIFLGWLNAEEMECLIKISKLGAYCMRNLMDFENAFGNKIIQYMAGELPVLNSTQGYAKDYLNEFNAGVTYHEGDPADCASAIESLYVDEEERITKAQNAKRQFDEKFEINKVNSQYENFIYKILNNEGEKNETDIIKEN